MRSITTFVYVLVAAVICVVVLVSSTSAQQTRPSATAPAAGGSASTGSDSTASNQLPQTVVMRNEAKALRTLATSALGNQFLDAAADLPSIDSRTLYRDKTTRQWHSKAQADAMTQEQRKNLQELPVDESRYYQTKYGSPLAYVRPLDLLGAAGVKTIAQKRLLDIGYGTIGHLRMLASRGANVVGLDVDTFLTALYSEPQDTGDIASATGGKGHIALVNGLLADEKVREQVGGGYDLIIAKNTLKRGYIHPEPAPGQTVDKRQLIDLGMGDEAFIAALHDMLKPGGMVMIYNLCPAPAAPDKPYIAWADGRCPFSREALEKAGFTVREFDHDDSAAARTMAHLLGWDSEQGGAMDLEHDLFAHYTLLEKPAAK